MTDRSVCKDTLTKGAEVQQRMTAKERVDGGVAQLGEHLPCKQGVRSSILLVSTRLLDLEN